ncbi:MAG: serine hydrolase domain-containing protein, partial [Cellvibrio sp.]
KPVAPAVLGLAASGPGEDEEEALAASLAQEELVIENSVGIEGAAAAVEDKVMAESAEPESESIPVQPAFVDPAADAPETAPVVTAVKNVPLPMSENREAYITKFKDYVETKVAPRLPGIAIAVISEGKVKVLQAYGVKKAGTREFIDTDTAFRLASCSKTIAGTAAGILVNDGILKWDTPVVSILPNIQFSNPRYGNQISLRDILAQSTGLPTHAGDNYIEDGLPFDSVVQKLKSVNFICPPGKCYGYQNVTFSLFDGMVRNRTGKAYEQYVQEKLFNPLGMRTASFGMAGLKARNNYALPHTASRKGWQTEVITENYYRMHPAAGANASITDMARWVLAQMGKKPDVLSPAVLSAVHDKVTKNTPTQSHYGAREGVTDTHYGIGWRVFDYRGDKNFMHHGGYVLGFQSQMVFNAELQIGMVALSNSNKMPTNIIFEFLDAYEDEKRGPRKMILPPVTPAKKRPRQKGR